MSMRQTSNPNLVQIGREGASGQLREIYGLSFLFLFFPTTRLLKRPIGQWGTPGSLLAWWRHRRGGCLHCLL